jgi:hypothetical protein
MHHISGGISCAFACLPDMSTFGFTLPVWALLAGAFFRVTYRLLRLPRVRTDPRQLGGERSQMALAGVVGEKVRAQRSVR